jgi:hypothetical protein
VRKALRKIYGPVLANGQWRNRYKNEVYNLFKGMDVTRNIRLRRFQWVGYMLRVKDERAPTKALKGYISGRRPVWKPRGRWIDAVDRDAKRKLKCKNWSRTAEDRDDWRRKIKEAKVQSGL